MSVSRFRGFPQDGLALLAELPKRDKAWFESQRARYLSALLEPAKAFVLAVEEQLRERISPEIEGEPKINGSISPIHRDIRFSADKTPYKDHLLIKWWQGEDKKTAPTLYVRLTAREAGFASGSALTALDRWRELIDDQATGIPFAAAVAKLTKAKKAEVAGADLKRVPAPYSADHPRGDLLRHKMFQIRWSEPLPASVGSAGFASWCAKRLEGAADIHHWLVSKLS